MSPKVAEKLPTPDQGWQFLAVIGIAVIVYLSYASYREQSEQRHILEEGLAWQNQLLEANAKANGTIAQATVDLEDEESEDDSEVGEDELRENAEAAVERVEQQVRDGQPKPAEGN